jgi:DNA-binding CsgD family transcriptional regulator
MLPASLTLTLRGSDHSSRLPESVVQHFGLTPAEFRLCAALADGVSLKACAQNWNRSYETLRSQLKTVLAKTGTHRQAELVALLDTYRTH